MKTLRRLVKTVAILILAMDRIVTAEAIPRPEFPQPQFERADWLNLNGPWEFEFDDEDQGLTERWEMRRKFSRTIIVPFAFEGSKSGIGDATTFHPVVWYRRGFRIPSQWKGRRVLLNFGAVDYRATVWLNTRELGRHEGGHVPFRFDITDLLEGKDNVLTVRAEDPPVDRSIPRGKQSTSRASFGMYYTRTTGIWQTVWLEAAGSSFLERARITPDQSGSVQFDLRVARPRPGLELRIRIHSAGQMQAEVTAPPVGSSVSARALISSRKLWSPESPHLYDVTFELISAGDVLDRVKSYFGFRAVSVEGRRVAINGQPVYLKMVVDQGYWPGSTMTPPSDEAIQFDIQAVKDMGFNGARKHQKLEDPRYLYWADRLGLLVSSEMANAFRFDEESMARFQREWREAIERDYNHPSIFVWTPINESWGVQSLREARPQAYLKSLVWMTRGFDSTRLVVDNDGYQHTDLTDLFTLHAYSPTGSLLARRYKDLGKPGAPVPVGENQRLAPLPAPLIPGHQYNGSPLILSEFGSVAYAFPGQQVRDTVWGGRERVEKTSASALARLRTLYEAIAAIPAITGVCYMQLTDTEDELNGLLTADRRHKYDPRLLRELNAMLR